MRAGSCCSTARLCRFAPVAGGAAQQWGAAGCDGVPGQGGGVAPRAALPGMRFGLPEDNAGRQCWSSVMVPAEPHTHAPAAVHVFVRRQLPPTCRPLRRASRLSLSVRTMRPSTACSWPRWRPRQRGRVRGKWPGQPRQPATRRHVRWLLLPGNESCTSYHGRARGRGPGEPCQQCCSSRAACTVQQALQRQLETFSERIFRVYHRRTNNSCVTVSTSRLTVLQWFPQVLLHLRHPSQQGCLETCFTYAALILHYKAPCGNNNAPKSAGAGSLTA